MTRTTWITLGLLLVLTLVFVVLKEQPVTTIEPPLTVSAVDALHRIEWTTPDGETVELERQPDDRWLMKQPIESLLTEATARKIETIFGNDIHTDDIFIDPSKAADYDLHDDAMVTLSLFRPGQDTAISTLHIGKEIQIEQTRAKRTFIRQQGNDKIYRAHSEVGSFVRQPINTLREKQLFDIPRNDIESIDIAYHEGIAIKITKDDDDQWAISQPIVDFEVDTSALSRLVSTMSRLTATGFADDITPQRANLEPPTTVVTISTTSAQYTLYVGDLADDAAHYFAQKEGDATIYTLSTNVGSLLTNGTVAFRDKTALKLVDTEIASIRISGHDTQSPIRLRRQNDSWKLSSRQGDQLNENTVQSLIRALTPLRVQQYVIKTASEVGLTAPSEQVEITMKDGTSHILSLGDTVNGTNGNRYAMLNSDYPNAIFILPGHIISRLQPDIDSLTHTPEL